MIAPTTCKLPGCTNSPTGGRGLCAKDYAVYRRKQVAYGTWDSGRVMPDAAQYHLSALRAAGMGTRRIEELTGLSRPTLQGITKAQFLSRYTQDRILSVPIPLVRFDGVLAPGTQIPIIGSTRRLRALSRIGWNAEVLGDRLKVGRNGVVRATAPMQHKITVRRARDISGLFNELQLTPGPSRKAARLAEIKGWLPPLAWDEDSLDNPYAAADLGADDPVPFPDVYVEMRFLGLSDAEIASRLGVQAKSLERLLQRNRDAIEQHLGAPERVAS